MGAEGAEGTANDECAEYADGAANAVPCIPVPVPSSEGSLLTLLSESESSDFLADNIRMIVRAF